MSAASYLLLWAALHTADAGPLATDAGPLATDAGPAATDAGAAATDAGMPVAERAPAFAVRVHERDTPLVFRLEHAGKDARRRAVEAGDALEAALTHDAEAEAPLVQIAVGADVAQVRVRGRAVATLTPGDAAAEGAPDLAHYSEELETRLLPFVQDDLRRSSAQAIALSVFLFVFFGVLGVLTLRALRTAFDRLEKILEERSAGLQPLKLLSIPLLSAEALRGLLLVGIFVGRILGYLVVVAVALGAALSQFEVTRPWLGRIASALLSPLVSGVDAGARAVPGLLLATLLVVVTVAGLRFARLLLDGVAQGRVEARLIRPARVPATRVGIAVVTLLAVAPLVVAAAFGRFGTPLETLAVAVGGAVMLGAVPVLASAAVGMVMLWRGTLRAGEWIEVGAVHGEVSSISVLDVVLVPESGGTVVLPMLVLALKPLSRRPAPSVSVVVHVKRDRPWAELEPRLLAVAKAVDAAGRVALLDAGLAMVRCELSVPLGKPDARHALSLQLLLASERGELALLDPP